MTSQATVQRTACTVAVHLAAHHPTAASVRHWCAERAEELADARVTAHSSETALREAVPGLDWRSDRGRSQLRAHLVTTGSTLFSSSILLGEAYRHTGGRLHADAGAGIDALAVAVRDAPARIHLTVGDHASTAVRAWIDAVRQGHLVRFDDFARTVVDPSWVPLVERLAKAFGGDRVVVHDATAARPGSDTAAGTAVARGLLDALLEDLGAEVEPTSLAPPPAGPDPTHWSLRQTEVALAILPHLRSRADRLALRRFVQEEIDIDGVPAWPVTPRLAEDLAARDAVDLTRIRELAEVR